jgi:hypothetical protein
MIIDFQQGFWRISFIGFIKCAFNKPTEAHCSCICSNFFKNCVKRWFMIMISRNRSAHKCTYGIQKLYYLVHNWLRNIILQILNNGKSNTWTSESWAFDMRYGIWLTIRDEIANLRRGSGLCMVNPNGFWKYIVSPLALVVSFALSMTTVTSSGPIAYRK